jgi:L-ascorbate metabolism protein UlaG (beta-lactamase superfamily)
MLTITSEKGSLLLNVGKRTVVIFPDASRKVASGELHLLGAPEEESREGVISWPGEYDVDGIAIRGIGHEEGKAVSYMLEVEGVHFGLVHSPLAEWSDYEVELMGNIDVLCVPSDNPKVVQKLVDDIDPRVLIPVKTGGGEKYAETLKVCGATGKETVEKYVVKTSGLPSEGREVVIFAD